jgi:hypothetical protein
VQPRLKLTASQKRLDGDTEAWVRQMSEDEFNDLMLALVNIRTEKEPKYESSRLKRISSVGSMVYLDEVRPEAEL